MKRTWRFWIALWASKLTGFALKLLGKKATTFPGVLAQRIHPEILRDLGANYGEGIIIVTGTNGKTTTSNLLAGILQTAGKEVAFNQAGANMLSGITGALIANTTWTGSTNAQMALLEVDEATVPKLCRQLTPRLAVVTNFFRDQLDRYGELDTTVRLVKQALPAATTLILNADDPLVAQFGINGSKVRYYGVERTPESRTDSSETREARFCPACGQVLEYSLYHYGQLGLFNCSSCGFSRPLPDSLAEHIHLEEGKIVFRVGVSTFELGMTGFFNLYNALAALAAARELGVGDQDSISGLRQFVPQAGRMERFVLGSGSLTLALVKNPTGFNQIISTMLGQTQHIDILIAINDLAADGRDISWLWDADFERLGQADARVGRVICSGLRAEDMALRLKYAGVAEDKILLEKSLEQAVELLEACRQQGAAFVLPTYTALFPTRDILAVRSQSRTEQEEGRS